MSENPALALLVDAFGRVPQLVESAVDGLGRDQLSYRPGPEANTIAWLIWHLSRGEDLQVSEVSGQPQIYREQGFDERFGFGFPLSDMGYGHTTDDVARVVVDDAGVLVDYYRAVSAGTRTYLDSLVDTDLARVVDRKWDPPVTLGARLISVVGDDLQHAGQANYLRGLLAT